MIVRESISQFVRGGDPKRSLEIGAVAQIHQLFNSLSIKKPRYQIDENLKITVFDDLWITRSDNVEYLPDNLRIEATAFFSNSRLKEFPKNLWIDGNLFIRDCENIQEIPAGIHIGWSIYAGNSGILYLPDNLLVGGDLDLTDTPIKSLPSGLKVKRNLTLDGSQIESIPEDLIVEGTLYLRETKILYKIPNEVRARTEIIPLK